MAQEQTKNTVGRLSAHPEGKKVRARDKVYVRWVKNAPGERQDVTGKKAFMHPEQAARLVEKGFVKTISEDEYNTPDPKPSAKGGGKKAADTEV